MVILAAAPPREEKAPGGSKCKFVKKAETC